MNCSNCNAALTEESQFCSLCGYKVTKPSLSGESPHAEKVSVICASCGEQLSSESLFCSKCGSRLAAPFVLAEKDAAGQANPSSKEVDSLKSSPKTESETLGQSTVEATINVPIAIKLRHGFTTFWLWGSLLAYGIGGVVVIVMDEMKLPELNTENGLIYGLAGLANAVFSIMLLSWKKSGFYLMAVVSIITSFLFPAYGIVKDLAIAIVGMAILYGILKMKNAFGKSTWDQLE